MLASEEVCVSVHVLALELEDVRVSVHVEPAVSVWVVIVPVSVSRSPVLQRRVLTTPTEQRHSYCDLGDSAVMDPVIHGSNVIAGFGPVYILHKSDGLTCSLNSSLIHPP